jgi:transcriptional regulator with XRE-family HTH domain
MRRALAHRDIATVFRILGKYGMPQRAIARRTGQSQSEVSNICNGRFVMSYDTLVRIADGLGIPRGWMGLAYEDTSPMLADLGQANENAVRWRLVVELPPNTDELSAVMKDAVSAALGLGIYAPPSAEYPTGTDDGAAWSRQV